MKTKSQQVTELLEAGNLKKALKMLKGFKLGLTEEQRRILSLTHEMQQDSRIKFYSQMKIDYKEIFRKFCQVVNSIWLKDSDVKVKLEEKLSLHSNESHDDYVRSKEYLESKNITVPFRHSQCLNLAYETDNEERFGGTQDFMNYINGK